MGSDGFSGHESEVKGAIGLAAEMVKDLNDAKNELIGVLHEQLEKGKHPLGTVAQIFDVGIPDDTNGSAPIKFDLGEIQETLKFAEETEKEAEKLLNATEVVQQELAELQDHMETLTEEEVVEVMEKPVKDLVGSMADLTGALMNVPISSGEKAVGKGIKMFSSILGNVGKTMEKVADGTLYNRKK